MLRVLLSCCLLLFYGYAAARVTGPVEVEKPKAVRDLADIRKSAELRVLVNQSRNSSGEIKGQSIGIEYRRLRAFEQYLNRNALDGRTIKLKVIPKAKDQLLAALQRGEGDLVAPGELLSTVQGSHIAATSPIVREVAVIIVTRQGSRHYQSIEQLSGRSVALPAGSVAGQAIDQVNQRLLLSKRAPILIEWVDPSLAAEDVLEMVQAGIYPVTAVEQPIAQRWVKVMPKLRLDSHLKLLSNASMRWYVRRDTPMLGASIDRFLKSYKPPADGDTAFQRFYRRQYKVYSPMGRADRQRLEKVRPVLQRYAQQHGFDWLALAALAFKESTLNASARGSGGATGLMQITPAAAAAVGVSNIARLDNNVQASAKYLAMIRRNYFNSPQLNERERMAFILAGYNLGPHRVQGMRAEAKRRGLNPNQWFFQVERVAMEQVGMSVVNYVNSVNKYFLAFSRERYLLEP